MFLDKISSENRELFLALCYKAVACDYDINDEEVEQLTGYSKALGVNCDLKKFESMNTEDIIGKLNAASAGEKKIIVSELLGILMGDFVYDEAEVAFYKECCRKLGIDQDTVEKIEKVVRDYLEALSEYTSFIIDDQ